MSYHYNRREINNQVFLIELYFPTYDPTNDGNQFVLTLDKYLSVDIWAQIYKKIETVLQAYSTDATAKDETINLSRAQLELDMSWKSVRTYHKDINKQFKEKGCDNPSEKVKVLYVKVRMYSALDKYRKQHGIEKVTEKKKSSVSIDSEPNTSGSTSTPVAAAAAAAAENRLSNGSTSQSQSQPQSQHDEEYVPEPLTEVSSGINYTPSTLSNSIENIVAASPIDVHDDDNDDVYTPAQKNGNNDSQIITYTPTKITNTSKNRATDLNRNNYTHKKTNRLKNKNLEIFGGDSGDEAESRLRRNLPSTPADKPKLQGRLDGWVSQRPKRHDTKKDCDRDGEKKKMRKIAPNDKMNEDEKMRRLRAAFEAEEMKNEVTIEKHIDLKDMTVDDIIETFPRFESKLKRVFQKNLNVPDHRWEPKPDQCDYLVVLNQLLNDTQQTQMYLKLASEFAKESAEHITSSHENLFWKGMLPEWALLIFMDTFTLNRAEATKQLTDQNLVSLRQDYPLDLGGDI